MSRQIFVLGALLATLLLPGPTAHAAGWSSGLQTARSVGMGNAFHAVADTPIALHFNPAGIAQIDKMLGIQVGLHVPVLLNYSASYEYTDPAGNSESFNHESKEIPYIPHLLLTTDVLNRFIPSKNIKVNLGIGWYIPMGGGTVKFNGMKLAHAQMDPTTNKLMSNLSNFESSMAIHYLSVGAAASFWDVAMVGATFNVHFADVGLKQQNYPKYSAATAGYNFINNEFSGLGISYSGSFSLMLQDPSKVVRLGVGYKMEYKVEAQGETKFTVLSPTAKGLISGDPAKGGFGLKLPTTFDSSVDFYIPHIFMVGISFQPTERLLVSASIDYTLWSKTEALTLNWHGLEMSEALLKSKALTRTIDLPSGNDDVLTFMVGGEFKVLKDNLPIRLGFILNPAAKEDNAQSVASIDTTSYIICYGAGYNVGISDSLQLNIDLGFYHLIGEESGPSKEFLTSAENYDDSYAPIYSGPAGDYNKNILFGALLDLTLLIK